MWCWYYENEFISINVKDEWYYFNGIRWERTLEGNILKSKIHNEIYNIYYEYQSTYYDLVQEALNDPDLDNDTRKDIQAGKTKEGRWLKNIQDIQMVYTVSFVWIDSFCFL